MIDFVQEFSAEGMFAKTFKRVEFAHEPLVLDLLKREVLTYNKVVVMADQMTRDVALTTVLSVDHGYIHLRMQKHDRSMGFMFAYVNSLKDNYFIREYSIQQATLEQIFNSFAKGLAFKRLNRRLTDANRITKAPGSEANQIVNIEQD